MHIYNSLAFTGTHQGQGLIDCLSSWVAEVHYANIYARKFLSKN